MPVYLDHNASTPLAEEARAAMQPWLEGKDACGNPSSVHRWGRLARAAVEHARVQVAELVGAGPEQVIFTSGATEANNLALQGWAAGTRERASLAVSAVEHPSVRVTAQALARRGLVEMHTLAVDEEGRLDGEALDLILQEARPGLVSVMLANNETGVIQDIAAIARRVREAGWLLHSDAAQAAGRMEVDFPAMGVHMMSLSAHKLNGPKGVGALVIERGVSLVPLLYGGGHEDGLRSGTENVAAIVGFGAAAELARHRLEARRAQLTALRQRLEAGLRAMLQVVLFAELAPRLPNTVCFAVPGIEGSTLVMRLDRRGIAISSGSSCDSHSGEPSHVLLAMGVAPELARCAVRASLGEDSTADDVDALLEALRGEIGALAAPALAAWAPL